MRRTMYLIMVAASAAVALSLGGRVSAPSAAAQDKGTEDSPAGKVSVEAWIKKHELWLERLEKASKKQTDELTKTKGTLDETAKKADNDAGRIRVLEGRVATDKGHLGMLALTSPPIGSVIAFAGQWPPKRDGNTRWTDAELGWTIADGDKISDLPGIRPEHVTTLSGVLGSDRIPDYQGLFLRGYDPASRKDPEGSGRAIGSYQPDSNQSHAHAVTLGGGCSWSRHLVRRGDRRRTGRGRR